MDKVAALSPSDRADLFQETAAKRGIDVALIEKDFWVCWALKKMFSAPEIADHLVFKGGTSLSKVYGLIRRFSEDIDLVLDWRLLGHDMDGETHNVEEMSNNQRQRLGKELNDAATEYIARSLCPQLESAFASCADVSIRIDDEDKQKVDVTYPKSFPNEYTREAILLEVGPLASWVPSQEGVVTPYAAEEFPEVFESPECPVRAIRAERTFWEKATILHMEANRGNVASGKYARHYYDVYCLARSPIRQMALADLALLQDVVNFKNCFYYVAGAKYNEARPGTFKLVPSVEKQEILQRDYTAMREMLFGEIPSFEEIIVELQGLEDEINGMGGDCA
jgi:Nucleotidyl transferase AbiEii toxin, Type IV TA system